MGTGGVGGGNADTNTIGMSEPGIEVQHHDGRRCVLRRCTPDVNPLCAVVQCPSHDAAATNERRHGSDQDLFSTRGTTGDPEHVHQNAPGHDALQGAARRIPAPDQKVIMFTQNDAKTRTAEAFHRQPGRRRRPPQHRGVSSQGWSGLAVAVPVLSGPDHGVDAVDGTEFGEDVRDVVAHGLGGQAQTPRDRAGR